MNYNYDNSFIPSISPINYNINNCPFDDIYKRTNYYQSRRLINQNEYVEDLPTNFTYNVIQKIPSNIRGYPFPPTKISPIRYIEYSDYKPIEYSDYRPIEYSDYKQKDRSFYSIPYNSNLNNIYENNTIDEIKQNYHNRNGYESAFTSKSSNLSFTQRKEDFSNKLNKIDNSPKFLFKSTDFDKNEKESFNFESNLEIDNPININKDKIVIDSFQPSPFAKFLIVCLDFDKKIEIIKEFFAENENFNLTLLYNSFLNSHHDFIDLNDFKEGLKQFQIDYDSTNIHKIFKRINKFSDTLKIK